MVPDFFFPGSKTWCLQIRTYTSQTFFFFWLTINFGRTAHSIFVMHPLFFVLMYFDHSKVLYLILKCEATPKFSVNYSAKWALLLKHVFSESLNTRKCWEEPKFMCYDLLQMLEMKELSSFLFHLFIWCCVMPVMILLCFVGFSVWKTAPSLPFWTSLSVMILLYVTPWSIRWVIVLTHSSSWGN